MRRGNCYEQLCEGYRKYLSSNGLELPVDLFNIEVRVRQDMIYLLMAEDRQIEKFTQIGPDKKCQGLLVFSHPYCSMMRMMEVLVSFLSSFLFGFLSFLPFAVSGVEDWQMFFSPPSPRRAKKRTGPFPRQGLTCSSKIFLWSLFAHQQTNNERRGKGKVFFLVN